MRKQFKNAVLARTQARKFLDEATSIKEALRELNEIDVDDKPLPTTGAAIKKKKKKVVAGPAGPRGADVGAGGGAVGANGFGAQKQEKRRGRGQAARSRAILHDEQQGRCGG